MQIEGGSERCKNKNKLKITDVRSHFSKGVSFRELGKKLWPRTSSKYSMFTKIKNEFSHWHWNALLPIHDLNGVVSVTHDENTNHLKQKRPPQILAVH